MCRESSKEILHSIFTILDGSAKKRVEKDNENGLSSFKEDCYLLGKRRPRNGLEKEEPHDSNSVIRKLNF